MDSARTQVYVILGAAGSGRREIVADLVEANALEGAAPVVFLEAGELPSEFDARLPVVQRWEWRDDEMIAELPSGGGSVFFVVEGRSNPVEQMDRLQAVLTAANAEIARILCVVNCQLAEKNPPLLAWYEACIHFSDVVLLTHRDGVSNKWVSEFLRHFEKLFYPCLFELVKNGRVRNPALILIPEARRMTHIFDAEQDWVFTNAAGEKIDEEDETEDDEELEAAVEEDPYFQRDAAGRRVKRLPDITKYLPARVGN